MTRKTGGTDGIVVIVMGVSGCGKSTVAARLAKHLCGHFEDGDDLHPPENIARMSAGIPLTDEDRMPWLAAVRDHAVRAAREHGLAVVACSALRRRYRDILRGTPEGVDGPADDGMDDHAGSTNTGTRVFHVFLDGSRELIASRMSERAGHFMPATMLDSQFGALESPLGEAGVVTIDIAPAPERIARAAADALLARDDFTWTGKAPRGGDIADLAIDPEPS